MNRRFNLLPHRELKHRWCLRVLGRQLLVVSGAGLVSILLVEGVLQLRVSYLEGYHRALSAAVSQLLPSFAAAKEASQRRNDLLERQNTLEKLDARRSTSVMILDGLARAMLQELYITRLEENGDTFRLEGRAVDTTTIASFFEVIVKSERLSNLELEEIRTVDEDQQAPYLFIINGQVRLIGMEGMSPHERQP